MSIFISVCFYLHFVNTFTSVWVIVFISIFILSNLPLRFRFQLITIGWMRAEYRYNKNSPRNVGVLQRAQKQAKVVACLTGGICVGVLYCFGGGATRRVVIQVIIKGSSFAVFPHAKIPRGFAARFAWRLRHQKSSQGTIIPPATLAKSVLEVFSKASCNSDQFPSPVLVWQIVIYLSVYLFSDLSFFLFFIFHSSPRTIRW